MNASSLHFNAFIWPNGSTLRTAGACGVEGALR
ncbi:hypothetical protein SAMN05421869_10815 [Nonomuraea jiangxiensis]|uniref:Uncharacterized protein n=1 Tax=Nonomuraea jiangxiensis TaxID=633440 RepID=A0A1G8PSX4_9ACTN|nr:hypothetical protein SAMN05421869_10815 [Nonomuraea jiangxiensis]